MEKHGAILFGVCCLLGLSIEGGETVQQHHQEKKRSAIPVRDTDEYPDYPVLGVRYDEYPMIVPKKRAALLLDRLMVALQKAIEEEDEQPNRVNQAPSRGSFRNDDVRSMDLQRRGHQSSLAGQQKGRVYWRCYFNAVTCFK